MPKTYKMEHCVRATLALTRKQIHVKSYIHLPKKSVQNFDYDAHNMMERFMSLMGSRQQFVFQQIISIDIHSLLSNSYTGPPTVNHNRVKSHFHYVNSLAQ